MSEVTVNCNCDACVFNKDFYCEADEIQIDLVGECYTFKAKENEG